MSMSNGNSDNSRADSRDNADGWTFLSNNIGPGRERIEHFLNTYVVKAE